MTQDKVKTNGVPPGAIFGYICAPVTEPWRYKTFKERQDQPNR